KTVSKVFWWLLNIALGFAVSAGYFIGGIRSDYDHLKSEQVLIKQTNATIAERVTRVETKLLESSNRQDKALEEIKTLIVQTRPMNSAPSLQTKTTRRQ